MKNGPFFLLGLLVATVLSWGAIVLGSSAQLATLAPYYDEGESQSFPLRASGLAGRGQLVYADLGCAACHTQQVRRPDYGSDQARGWGDRQSVARDYLYQVRPQLGASRIGPDLANLAGRKPSAPDAEDLLNMLYAGSPTHPSYSFLFEKRRILGERANDALRLTGRAAPAAGDEIVPTDRARTLVAYLLSLNSGYEFPEAHPVELPSAKPEAKPAPKPEAAPAPGAPAKAGSTEATAPATGKDVAGKKPESPPPPAAPDEKKKAEGKK
jgi:cytochrome c oxidase cbb3-type subunit II